MAVDIFLVSKDVKGESTDTEFPDSIQVTEVRWGIQGGGHGATYSPEVKNVTIRKKVDRSSPLLWAFSSSHGRITEMKLHFRKAGKNPLTFLTIRLGEVYVTSTDLEVGVRGDEPEDIVELDFLNLDAEYQPQSKTGGRSGGTVSFHWQGRED